MLGFSRASMKRDHSKSIRDLTKRSVDVYSHPDTFIKLGIKSHRAKPIFEFKPIKIKGFTITAFPTEHDCISPLGYQIDHKEFGRLIFVTDTYYVKYVFSNVNYLMIECNYSKVVLDKLLEEGKVEKFLADRIFASHLSLESVIKFLKANNLSKLEQIYLMHLSENNSNADQFKTEIQGITGVPVEVCNA